MDAINSNTNLLARMLNEKSLTIGTAESCTGGSLASTLTSIKGSSSYFRGSIIAYQKDIKQSILGVKKETLEKYTVVSEAVAKEMASGAKQILSTDIIWSTTGYSGPSGGDKNNPVGTIWCCILFRDQAYTYRLRLSGGRLAVIKQATSFLLRETIRLVNI